MRGLHKSKRITWAPDVNLCQERLFLSEESPSQVGLGAQDHLQAKSSWLSHSHGLGTDDILPPGFEGAHSPNQLQINLSEIPLIKWICPPRIQLDITWQVVAGEESEEVEIQNQRERRVLEAVYPRPSAIPPNPSIPMDIEHPQYNDQQTPLIPITPIEDEEAVTDVPCGSIAPFSIPMSLQPPVLAPGYPPPRQSSIPGTPNCLINDKPTSGTILGVGVDPNVVAAVVAALTQISKNNEQGSLIDHDLLIKILSDPKAMEKLVADYGGASNKQNLPKPVLPSIQLSDHSVSLSNPSIVRINAVETNSPSIVAASSGAFYSQASGVGAGHLPNPWSKLLGVVPASSPPSLVPASSSPSLVPQAKDINYCKSLIQQHGEDRQETTQQYRPETNQQFGSRYGHQAGTNQEFLNNPKSRESKSKIMKPCIYFNSSRGCRHGANCLYQHDASTQQRGTNMPEVQNAKRMKMDRQISS